MACVRIDHMNLDACMEEVGFDVVKKQRTVKFTYIVIVARALLFFHQSDDVGIFYRESQLLGTGAFPGLINNLIGEKVKDELGKIVVQRGMDTVLPGNFQRNGVKDLLQNLCIQVRGMLISDRKSVV